MLKLQTVKKLDHDSTICLTLCLLKYSGYLVKLKVYLCLLFHISVIIVNPVGVKCGFRLSVAVQVKRLF